jgi:hypothetical protein
MEKGKKEKNPVVPKAIEVQNRKKGHEHAGLKHHSQYWIKKKNHPLKEMQLALNKFIAHSG